MTGISLAPSRDETARSVAGTALTGLAVAATLLVSIGGHSPLRALVVGLFLVVAPGGAVVGRLKLADRLERVVLAVAASLAIATLAAEAMTFARAWSPALLVDVLAAATVAIVWTPRGSFHRTSAPPPAPVPARTEEVPEMTLVNNSHAEEIATLSAQLDGARAVERQLRAEIDELRAERAAPLTQAEFLAAVGVEAAGVLRAAHEAAERMLARARADSAELVRAERLRLANAWAAAEKMFEPEAQRLIDEASDG